MLFGGEVLCSLDDKNRLTVPSGYREKLGEVFYVTKGFDQCLFVFPEDKWSLFEHTISSLPMSRGRSIQRFFFSGAKECSPDKQGRVLLPQNLREYAGLEAPGEVVVAGVDGRLEIWSKQNWNRYSQNIDPDDIAHIMEELNV